MREQELIRLLRDWDAAALLGVSRATFWCRVDDGTLPKPRHIQGLTRWLEAEIIDFIERALARRDGEISPGG